MALRPRPFNPKRPSFDWYLLAVTKRDMHNEEIAALKAALSMAHALILAVNKFNFPIQGMN